MNTNKLPVIPVLEDATELLAVISNSQKWKERLEKMIAHEEFMQAAVAKAEKIGDLEQALNLAASDRAEAERIRKEAEEYAERTKKEADVVLESAKEKIQTRERELAEQGVLWAEQLRQVREENSRLQIFDATVRKAEEEAQAKLTRAEGLLKRANEIREDYQDRLEQIKKLSA